MNNFVNKYVDLSMWAKDKETPIVEKTCENCAHHYDNPKAACAFCIGLKNWEPMLTSEPYVGPRSNKDSIDYLRYYHAGKSDPKKITNVVFNPPATIVFWGDGTKTVVKCQADDLFDPEKGLAMAIAKKFFDNKGSYCNQIKPWIEKWEEEQKPLISVDVSMSGSLK